MRLAGFIVLAGLIGPLAPSPAAAQGASTATRLDAQAQQLFLAGSAAQCLKAADLWRRAAEEYRAYGWTADRAAALRNTGRAFACAGADSVALGYYGQAGELDNAVASYQLLVLLEDSPISAPAGRGVQDEARFVGEVNRLLAALAPHLGADSSAQVTSVEDAQRTLENLARLRLAPITIRSEAGPVDVELRRWIYSVRQPAAPWERLTTDTTVRRSPAAYHFRYRDRATGRDTTIINLCADGCTVVIR